MKELEKLVDSRVKPLLEQAMHEKLGVTIAELETDISDRLKRSWEVVDVSLPFKQAKKKFKREYVAKLLRLKLGNVADVAKIANVDRRSIHRLISEGNIPVEQLREQAEYVKQIAVQDIIQESLEQYKSSLNPMKYQALYKSAPKLSKDIIREIPEEMKSLKDAEAEFETEYFRKALSESKNISQTARKIGLRFETLHRKLKKLKLIKN